ncbi:MAG: trypsin-like peptidase domain-containing protein [Aeromicrobium sp.]|uniref:S1C family serine protease n=1 Tax=Aeromicrobium sp. TaxID=1871063 RepID=UPI002611483F|nr:trypsin-like peptidase domain-containing protein [Aeromicrobium sp.]MDF1705711.1 trypsin-like peptidase domain-containing protein [Aeromicrobium sp.]
MNAPHDPFGEDAPRPAIDHDATSPSAPDAPKADDASAADSVPTQGIEANVVPAPPHDSADEPPVDPASAGAPATTSVLPAGSVVPPAPSAPPTEQAAPPRTDSPESASAVPPMVPPAATGGPATPPGGSGRGRRIAKAVGAGALIVVLAVGAGYGGAALQDRGDDGTTVPDGSSALDVPASDVEAPKGDVEKIAAEVMPSVVQINVRNGQEGGSGSGVVLSADGEILTNNHVVEAAADGGTITVAFSDGTNAEATILGRDSVTDLAVIKANGVSGLKPATLGSSSELRVGQDVIAIGSPFGLESTVTTGIVSALNRPVESSDASGDNATVFPAVQTDAAINPGNSGGPLIDLAGNVIGINSAIRTNSSASGSIGLGFAIPVDLARNVAQQLVDGKKVEHAKIGVTVTPATEEDELTGIGAEIRAVQDGGAGDAAGLQAGDIITALNDIPVASSSALVASVRGHQPGDVVKITYLRDGKTETTDVTLDSDGGELSEE